MSRAPGRHSSIHTMTTTTSWSQLVADAYARPANIDWCEANYATLDWVAEAWNTFSSIPMSFIALYGFWRAKQHLKWETRWAMAWGLLGVVGVGSALFHATLRHMFQAADELPMLYCNLIFVYLMLEEGSGCTHAPRKRWLAPLLVRGNIFFSFSCKGGGRRVQVFIRLVFAWTSSAHDASTLGSLEGVQAAEVDELMQLGPFYHSFYISMRMDSCFFTFFSQQPFILIHFETHLNARLTQDGAYEDV